MSKSDFLGTNMIWVRNDIPANRLIFLRGRRGNRREISCQRDIVVGSNVSTTLSSRKIDRLTPTVTMVRLKTITLEAFERDRIQNYRTNTVEQQLLRWLSLWKLDHETRILTHRICFRVFFMRVCTNIIEFSGPWLRSSGGHKSKSWVHKL